MAALRGGGLFEEQLAQLCNVVLSQPQADYMADVAAVLSRWHLVVLHKGRSGAFWRARVS